MKINKQPSPFYQFVSIVLIKLLEEESCRLQTSVIVDAISHECKLSIIDIKISYIYIKIRSGKQHRKRFILLKIAIESGCIFTKATSKLDLSI